MGEPSTDKLIKEAQEGFDELPDEESSPAPLVQHEEGVFFNILVTDLNGNPIYSE